MATDDAMKKLEERLTRLEASFSQGATAAGGAAGFPPNIVSDPAPWPGWGGYYPRWPWPHPIVDPAVFHRPIVDPAAFPHAIVDPAPGGFQQAARPATAAASLGRIGITGGDPPPPDVSRFSIAQLEASLHSINAEKARLTSMETMINAQLATLKKQG